MIKHFGRIFGTLLILQASALATPSFEEEKPSPASQKILFPEAIWIKIGFFLEDKDRLCLRRLDTKGAPAMENFYKIAFLLPPFEILEKFEGKDQPYPFTRSYFLRKSLRNVTRYRQSQHISSSNIYLTLKYLKNFKDEYLTYFNHRVETLYSQDKEKAKSSIAEVLKKNTGNPEGTDNFEIMVLYKTHCIKNLPSSAKKNGVINRTLLSDITQYIGDAVLGDSSGKKKNISYLYLKALQNFSLREPNYPPKKKRV